ncbi:UDP-N-acetylmuramate--L-alanine ligase [Bacteroidota bacterium]
MLVDKLHKVYFLGIGGIGMSALARYFNTLGAKVSGYDKTPSPLTDDLIDEGIAIHFEEDINKIPIDTDLVIYTPAIPTSNKEFIYITASKIPLVKRSKILGEITSGKFTVAVAGTHGKTSVSSIITHILENSGKKVCAFIGGIMKNYDSNFIYSEDPEIFVVEADEYDKSFLELNPDIAVITAIDADHLDIYGSFENLENAFTEFTGNIKTGGCLIVNEKIRGKNFSDHIDMFTCGMNSDNSAYISDFIINDGKTNLDLAFSGNYNTINVQWSLPGEYNMENALAASLVAKIFGIDDTSIKNSLENYKGVKRRFDIQIQSENLVYIDDYAHHPAEIKACIQGVRDLFPGKKICGVFQPHLFSRTKDFASEFAESLEPLNDIILLDIYPAREKPISGVDSGIILEKISNENKSQCSKEELIETLKSKDFDILLSLGAGNIDSLVDTIKEELLKRNV